MPGFRYNNVGFIGVGAMGSPMVIHLTEKLPVDCKVHVFDVFEKAVDEVCAQYPERILKAKNARDVAEKSDIIFSIVPEGSHVRQVYLDQETGVCSIDISSKLLIDCSTIDTATNLEVRAHILTHFPTAFFYDAPVSGGVLGAKKASIAFYLGCASDDPNLPRLTDLMSKMGKQIIPCGGPSLGLAAKLSNNYLSGLIAIACSEALDMGMRAGLDPRVLSKVYAAGTAQNTICDRFNPCPGVFPEAPSTNGYKEGFKIQLMKKDMGLAVDMAKRVGTTLVLGDAGLKTYSDASDDPNCRDLDSRVVYRFLGGNENWQGQY
ncbi:hypothetical protein FQN57_006010 [Myotisia sp. PD_48]|nr:hypothetical protein FQN57_006010 [Myotisia sp. PD_48]